MILTAHGGALGATLRVDAPEDVEPVNYAQTLTSYAATTRKPRHPPRRLHRRNPDGYPYAAHVAALVNELAAARMPVRNVWLVTSTYWTEFGTDEHHPLEEIPDSHANATDLLRQRHRRRRVQPRPAGNLGHAGGGTGGH